MRIEDRVGLRRIAFALAVLLTLSACSNGRGSVGEQQPVAETPGPPPAPPPEAPPPEQPPPPAPPPEAPPPEQPPPQEPPPEAPPPPEPVAPGSAALAGYWSGAVIDEDSGGSREGVAFVDRDGNMHLMVLRGANDPEFVVHGNVCCRVSVDDEIEGRRYLHTRDEEAEVEMHLTDGRLVGEMEFRNRDYEIDMQREAAFSEALTLQDLAGVYTRSDVSLFGSGTMTMSIDPDGAVNGSHSNGCIFNGTAQVPDVSRNMVRLTLEVAECGGLGSSRRWNGRYEGLGVLLRNAVSPSDGASREDIFYHSLVGPTWLGLMSVGR